MLDQKRIYSESISPLPPTTLASAIDKGNVVEQKDEDGSNLINPYDSINLKFLRRKQGELITNLNVVDGICRIRLKKALEVVDMILKQTEIDKEAWLVVKELLAFAIARYPNN